MIRIFAVLLFALTGAGCINHRSGFPLKSGAKAVWTEGVSVKKDIVAHWGNPHKIAGNTWIWRERTAKGGKIKAAYYMVGVTISNTAAATLEHHLSFDEAGVLTKWETVDSVYGGAKWSLWPF